VIVLDASAAVHLLLRTEGKGDWVLDRVVDEDRRVPQLFEYEVVSALRAASLRRELSPQRASLAFSDLEELSVTRYPPHALMSRVWELRSSLTAYDASYVALAEVLDVPLVTADARLGRAHGHGATVEVVPD
jgi:predicted nucleic acid-binding protein